MLAASWIVWRAELKWNEEESRWKLNKVPCDTGGGTCGADSDDAIRPFDQALKRAQILRDLVGPRGGPHYGVGITLYRPADLWILDLDGVLNQPELPERVEWLCQNAPTWAEVSVSGNGLHFVYRGPRPVLKTVQWRGGKTEVFGENKFVAITGARYRPELADGLMDDATLWSELEPLLTASSPSKNGRAFHARPFDGNAGEADDAILRKMFRSKSGAKIRALFDGDTSGHGNDQSAADLALAGHLAFWFGPAPADVDRPFRQSALMRDKWDEVHNGDGRTYGQMTIGKALDGRTEFYSLRGTNGVHFGSNDTPEHRAPNNAPAGGNPTNGKPETTEGDHPPDAHLTDVGNAQRFAAQHREGVMYCAPWGSWLCYTGTHWQRDEVNAIDLKAKATVRKMYDDAAEAVKCLANELRAIADGGDESATESLKAALDQARKMVGHALKTEDARAIGRMLRLAQSELAVSPAELDGDHYLFNCLNQTVNLRNRATWPHRREDMITRVAPVQYDPAAKCPLWDRALRAIFLDNDRLIEFVRRLFGLCLSGDASAQILAILHGGGANGKSLILETICAILGPYACPAPEGLLLVRRGEQHPTELADLFGRRLVHSTETGEGARLNETRVKRLTGGDTIKGRYMRQDFFEFPPTHKLLICTNHRPKIVGTDHAIWRRVVLVPFKAVFWDPSRPPKAGEVRDERFRQDPRLKAKLEAERPGILNWLLEGFSDWQENGLNPPEEVQAAVEEYQAAEDLIAQFVQERCSLNADTLSRIRSRDLFAAFAKWLDDTGERRTCGHNLFSRRITEITGKEPIRSNGSWFMGIELRNEVDEPTRAK